MRTVMRWVAVGIFLATALIGINIADKTLAPSPVKTDDPVMRAADGVNTCTRMEGTNAYACTLMDVVKK